jgi:hypothetical protein
LFVAADHAHVDLDCSLLPTRSNVFSLQDAQQLDLRGSGDLADFVEEQRPPSACSKRPTRRRSAPVNAPFSCPNSSLFEQALGQTRAVQGDERRLCARAERVHAPPALALAGAALRR